MKSRPGAHQRSVTGTRDEIVTNGTKIRGYDPATGKLLWTLGPNSEVTVATPVAGDGLVYVTAGYPPVRPIYAVQTGATGDISLPAGSGVERRHRLEQHARGDVHPDANPLRRIFLHVQQQRDRQRLRREDREARGTRAGGRRRRVFRVTGGR